MNGDVLHLESTHSSALRRDLRIMRIAHLALWTLDLERLRDFYARYFDARSGEAYHSATRRGFSSYFLDFPGGACRLELMTLPALAKAPDAPALGYAHLAIAVGSRGAVDALVARMTADGVRLASPARQTGDGYYEAVVEDPDGNLVEITA